ncbi:MAG: glycosyltransferase family 2 protein [Chryseolinea sp.]
MAEVSIIVPVYNRADIVSETIESVLKQTFSNWQLILVDDGSTDNSWSVLQQFAQRDSRITCVERPKNLIKGANSCRNFGLTMASAPFVKWVDSDDILSENNLAIQLSLIKNTSLNAVFSQSTFFDTASGKLGNPWSRVVHSNDIIWDYVRNQIRWHTGGVLWRRSFLQDAPFNVNQRNSQEWLMHGLQLLELRDNEYVITKDVVYFVRVGNLRMSSSHSSRYYWNQAKSRFLFLGAALSGRRISLKTTVELSKQIGIYLFHTLRKSIG